MALIICIEDNDDFREVVSYELQSAGHNVIESESGDKGLELIYKHKPDLIVSDVVMPNMTGLELLIKLRSGETKIAETPIIMFSAATHKHYQEEAIKYGVFEYILKPINWDSFMYSVKRAIDNPASA